MCIDSSLNLKQLSYILFWGSEGGVLNQMDPLKSPLNTPI